MTKFNLNHFKIVHNLTDDHISQLITYAKNDPDVRKFTRDAERFIDHGTTKKFIEQAHVCALLDDDQLSGIIWFIQKPLPEKKYLKSFEKTQYDTTFAIRLYGEAKGKKLSIPFMNEAFSRFKKEKKNTGIWLQTRADNTRAIYLYKKFGFKQISEPDIDGRIIMIHF